MQGFEKASKMQDRLNYQLDKDRERLRATTDGAGDVSADGVTVDRVRVFRGELFKRDHGDRT